MVKPNFLNGAWWLWLEQYSGCLHKKDVTL